MPEEQAERRVSSPPSHLAPLDRPDGALLFAMAGVALGAALILLIIGLMTSVEQYGQLDAGALARRWWLLVGAGFALQAGLIFLPTAFVVRALWFIPGDLRKPSSTTLQK